jgi:hypothetical protein
MAIVTANPEKKNLNFYFVVFRERARASCIPVGCVWIAIPLEVGLYACGSGAVRLRGGYFVIKLCC